MPREDGTSHESLNLTIRQWDALVAEKVMGWTRLSEFAGDWHGQPPFVRGTVKVPHYTGDFSAAWDVFQNIKDRLSHQREMFMAQLQYCVSFRERELNHRQNIAWPDVFWFVEPADICLAALKSVGVDISDDTRR